MVIEKKVIPELINKNRWIDKTKSFKETLDCILYTSLKPVCESDYYCSTGFDGDISVKMFVENNGKVFLSGIKYWTHLYLKILSTFWPLICEALNSLAFH